MNTIMVNFLPWLRRANRRATVESVCSADLCRIWTRLNIGTDVDINVGAFYCR